jgi:hypothetical protein
MLKIIDLIYLSYYKEGENNEKRWTKQTI